MTTPTFSEAMRLDLADYFVLDRFDDFADEPLIGNIYCSITGLPYATLHDDQLRLVIEHAIDATGILQGPIKEYTDEEVESLLDTVKDYIRDRNMLMCRPSPAVVALNGKYESLDPAGHLIIVLRQTAYGNRVKSPTSDEIRQANLSLVLFAEAFMSLDESERIRVHAAALSTAAVYETGHYSLTAEERKRFVAAIEACDFNEVVKLFREYHSRLDRMAGVRVMGSWETRAYHAQLESSVYRSNVLDPNEQLQEQAKQHDKAVKRAQKQKAREARAHEAANDPDYYAKRAGKQAAAAKRRAAKPMNEVKKRERDERNAIINSVFDEMFGKA